MPSGKYKRRPRKKYKRSFWSDMDIIRLIVYYPDMSNPSLAKKLGKSISSIHCQGPLLGLRKSAKYLRSIPGKKFFEAGKNNRFQKGQVSHNKGKSWDEFMSKAAQKNALKTTFKKGNKPHNTKTDHHISVRTGQDGWNYKYIRIAENLWEPLHVYNYKKKFGNIPKGKIIAFKNRHLPDREKASNLELITRAQNMSRNSIMRYPEDLQKTIRVLGKLKRTIKKKTNGTEQTQGSKGSPVRGNRKSK